MSSAPPPPPTPPSTSPRAAEAPPSPGRLNRGRSGRTRLKGRPRSTSPSSKKAGASGGGTSPSQEAPPPPPADTSSPPLPPPTPPKDSAGEKKRAPPPPPVETGSGRESGNSGGDAASSAPPPPQPPPPVPAKEKEKSGGSEAGKGAGKMKPGPPPTAPPPPSTSSLKKSGSKRGPPPPPDAPPPPGAGKKTAGSSGGKKKPAPPPPKDDGEEGDGGGKVAPPPPQPPSKDTKEVASKGAKKPTPPPPSTSDDGGVPSGPVPVSRKPTPPPIGTKAPTTKTPKVPTAPVAPISPRGTAGSGAKKSPGSKGAPPPPVPKGTSPRGGRKLPSWPPKSGQEEEEETGGGSGGEIAKARSGLRRVGSDKKPTPGAKPKVVIPHKSPRAPVSPAGPAKGEEPPIPPRIRKTASSRIAERAAAFEDPRTRSDSRDSDEEVRAKKERERLAEIEEERKRQEAETKRLEDLQRQIKQQEEERKRKAEEERLAEEKRKEEERLAEERRKEEERLAEEKRKEEERLAEERRKEEERLAEEARKKKEEEDRKKRELQEKMEAERKERERLAAIELAKKAAKKLEDEKSGAMHMQRVVRGFIARQRVHKLIAAIQRDILERKSAVKIQSVLKIPPARAQVERLRKAKKEAEEAEARRIEEEKRLAEEKRRNDAAMQIQRIARGVAAREEMRDIQRMVSATMIAAVIRGYIARKRCVVLRAEKKELEAEARLREKGVKIGAASTWEMRRNKLKEDMGIDPVVHAELSSLRDSLDAVTRENETLRAKATIGSIDGAGSSGSGSGGKVKGKLAGPSAAAAIAVAKAKATATTTTTTSTPTTTSSSTAPPAMPAPEPAPHRTIAAAVEALGGAMVDLGDVLKEKTFGKEVEDALDVVQGRSRGLFRATTAVSGTSNGAIVLRRLNAIGSSLRALRKTSEDASRAKNTATNDANVIQLRIQTSLDRVSDVFRQRAAGGGGSDEGGDPPLEALDKAMAQFRRALAEPSMGGAATSGAASSSHVASRLLSLGLAVRERASELRAALSVSLASDLIHTKRVIAALDAADRQMGHVLDQVRAWVSEDDTASEELRGAVGVMQERVDLLRGSLGALNPPHAAAFDRFYERTRNLHKVASMPGGGSVERTHRYFEDAATSLRDVRLAVALATTNNRQRLDDVTAIVENMTKLQTRMLARAEESLSSRAKHRSAAEAANRSLQEARASIESLSRTYPVAATTSKILSSITIAHSTLGDPDKPRAAIREARNACASLAAAVLSTLGNPSEPIGLVEQVERECQRFDDVARTIENESNAAKEFCHKYQADLCTECELLAHDVAVDTVLGTAPIHQIVVSEEGEDAALGGDDEDDGVVDRSSTGKKAHGDVDNSDEDDFEEIDAGAESDGPPPSSPFSSLPPPSPTSSTPRAGHESGFDDEEEDGTGEEGKVVRGEETKASVKKAIEDGIKDRETELAARTAAFEDKEQRILNKMDAEDPNAAKVREELQEQLRVLREEHEAERRALNEQIARERADLEETLARARRDAAVVLERAEDERRDALIAADRREADVRREAEARERAIRAEAQAALAEAQAKLEQAVRERDQNTSETEAIREVLTRRIQQASHLHEEALNELLAGTEVYKLASQLRGRMRDYERKLVKERRRVMELEEQLATAKMTSSPSPHATSNVTPMAAIEDDHGAARTAIEDGSVEGAPPPQTSSASLTPDDSGSAFETTSKPAPPPPPPPRRGGARHTKSSHLLTPDRVEPVPDSTTVAREAEAEAEVEAHEAAVRAAHRAVDAPSPRWSRAFDLPADDSGVAATIASASAAAASRMASSSSSPKPPPPPPPAPTSRHGHARAPARASPPGDAGASSSSARGGGSTVATRSTRAGGEHLVGAADLPPRRRIPRTEYEAKVSVDELRGIRTIDGHEDRAAYLVDGKRTMFEDPLGTYIPADGRLAQRTPSKPSAASAIAALGLDPKITVPIDAAMEGVFDTIKDTVERERIEEERNIRLALAREDHALALLEHKELEAQRNSLRAHRAHIVLNATQLAAERERRRRKEERGDLQRRESRQLREMRKAFTAKVGKGIVPTDAEIGRVPQLIGDAGGDDSYGVASFRGDGTVSEGGASGSGADAPVGSSNGSGVREYLVERLELTLPGQRISIRRALNRIPEDVLETMTPVEVARAVAVEVKRNTDKDTADIESARYHLRDEILGHRERIAARTGRARGVRASPAKTLESWREVFGGDDPVDAMRKKRTDVERKRIALAVSQADERERLLKAVENPDVAMALSGATRQAADRIIRRATSPSSGSHRSTSRSPSPTELATRDRRRRRIPESIRSVARRRSGRVGRKQRSRVNSGERRLADARSRSPAAAAAMSRSPRTRATHRVPGGERPDDKVRRLQAEARARRALQHETIRDEVRELERRLAGGEGLDPAPSDGRRNSVLSESSFARAVASPMDRGARIRTPAIAAPEHIAAASQDLVGESKEEDETPVSKPPPPTPPPSTVTTPGPSKVATDSSQSPHEVVPSEIAASLDALAKEGETS